jgi:alpha-L-rhamnosidase
MVIYDAKVNHLTNPMGFYMNRTVFSWKVQEASGTRQAAAKIIIATDALFMYIVFDSGWDDKADCTGWELPFVLNPRQRYFWRVYVQSDVGEEAVSDDQYFETGKMEEPWQAEWIAPEVSNTRLPVFEKRFSIRGGIKSARLYISGLGLYRAYIIPDKKDIIASIQDEKFSENVFDTAESPYLIGDEYLTPYCNDYNSWVQYQTYDIADNIKAVHKDAVLAVMLGNGWYKGRFGFNEKEEKGIYGDSWKLICELHIFYEDGSEDVIGSDDSWKIERSNITFSNIYDGETRDDTLGKMHAGGLENVLVCQPPKGALSERRSLPVRKVKIFKPKLLHTPAGESVFDLGQEITGIWTLCVHVPAGEKVHLQTGEILQEGNFYNMNLRSAKSEYWYISDGKTHVIEPLFTFYGYRYVKVEGIDHLKEGDFTGIAFSSDLEATGTIKTGNELVNQLISNVTWSMVDNFVDVPTDCPQRDERMGWTGDAQVFSSTAMYLRDSYAFYGKYLYDMFQEQKDRNGMVPDTVPAFDVKSTSAGWGDAACIIPWNAYVYYGDPHILIDQFPSMRAWVDYMLNVDGDDFGWGKHFHYGDWLALDRPNHQNEAVMGATDVEYIAYVYLMASAKIVAKAAHVLAKTSIGQNNMPQTRNGTICKGGKTFVEKQSAFYQSLEEQYSKISRHYFEYLKREYFSVTGRCCIKTQTALILALKYHLSENPTLVKKQIRELFEDNDGKLNTGFIGTSVLADTLSQNGMVDIVWQLLLNEDYPGWLYEVKLGATTIWERWNSLLPDGTISGTSMNSMNHYSYGAILEWLFRYAAGIDVRESEPGARKIYIVPCPYVGIRSLDALWDTPHGKCRVNWKLKSATEIQLMVTVPFDTEAELTIPGKPFESEKNFSSGSSGISGHFLSWDQTILWIRKNQVNVSEEGVTTVHLTAGTYYFSYESATPFCRVFTINNRISEILNDVEASKKLASIISLEKIPQHLTEMTVREMNEQYPEMISDDDLEKIRLSLEGTDANF